MSIEGLEGVNGILAEGFELFDDTGEPGSIKHACLSDIPFMSNDSVFSIVNTGVCSIAVCLSEKNKYSS